MDNQSIARVLDEIGDLLELKESNPFRIRAYRNAAAAVGGSAVRVADLSATELQAIPGIGKDLSGKIRELADTGRSAYHAELLEEFPASILDLLRLQGVGPKTVAMLYKTLGIRTIDDLEAAARDGRLGSIRGMGARKQALILKAIEEQRKYAGRHLAPEARQVADAIVERLQKAVPGLPVEVVGSLRRGAETCGDIDLLAAGDQGEALMNALVGDEAVERVLARGPTRSSVRLRGGYQTDLRVVPAESLGAALQYFTGSKAHNIALRDRAIGRGMLLNEYGLFRTEDDARICGATEAEIYEALGLRFIAPELREAQGELAAAEAGRLPRLVEVGDLEGDLHAHTDATDGKDTLEAMVRGAQAAGLHYLAITDHSKALAMANGLDERAVLAQARRIRELNRRLDGFTVLSGIECDILADGRLDLSEDCLAELDLVVASVHSRMGQDEAQMTDRLLAAIASPVVDIVGHPTGRKILQRDAYRMDVERVMVAAARAGVAMEINCQIDRLDLSDSLARLARDRGVKLVISSDAHSSRAFARLRWGIGVARRAWLEPGDVLNTQSAAKLKKSLRRARRTAS